MKMCIWIIQKIELNTMFGLELGRKKLGGLVQIWRNWSIQIVIPMHDSIGIYIWIWLSSTNRGIFHTTQKFKIEVRCLKV